MFSSAETNFDPARISDLYSRTVTAHIFEAPYAYDPLARPVKLVPLTAVGMPEVSDDFRVWTVRIKPGIHFADDPAFKGKKRELVAQDYVYAFQRVVDPANISPVEPTILDLKIRGLAAARDAAVKGKKPFDYDSPIEGIRVLDRYTLRFTLEEPRPALHRELGAVRPARCAGARGGRALRRHDRRASGRHRPLQVEELAAQLAHRAGAQPELSRDAVRRVSRGRRLAEGQAILARLKGRRLPMVDEVDIVIVSEKSSRDG